MLCATRTWRSRQVWIQRDLLVETFAEETTFAIFFKKLYEILISIWEASIIVKITWAIFPILLNILNVDERGLLCKVSSPSIYFQGRSYHINLYHFWSVPKSPLWLPQSKLMNDLFLCRFTRDTFLLVLGCQPVIPVQELFPRLLRI